MSNTAAPGVAINKSIVKGGAGLHPRYIRDAAARWVVWIGGLGVIAALLLIFVYLLSEVFPLFVSPELNPRPEIALPSNGTKTLYLAAEEQAELGVRVSDAGDISFIDLHSGASRGDQHLPGAGDKLAAIAVGSSRVDLQACKLEYSIVSPK